MHRDDRHHGMHAPEPAPVGGLGRRGSAPPFPARRSHRRRSSDGQSFTWANLDRRPPLPRHRGRDAAPPPERRTGSAPAKLGESRASRANPWAPPSSTQTTTPFVGLRRARSTRKSCTNPGWADCTRRQQPDSQKLARAARSRLARWAIARPMSTNQPLSGRDDGPLAQTTATATSSPVRPGRHGERRSMTVRRRRPHGACELHRTWPRVPTGSWRCLRPPVAPGTPSSTGVRLELSGEPSGALRGRTGTETRRKPQRPRSRLSQTASRSSWTAAPATIKSTDDFFADRRTNPSIGDVTCAGPLPHRPRPRSIRIDPEQRRRPPTRTPCTGFVNDLVGTNTDIGIVSFAAGSETSPRWRATSASSSASIGGD